MTMIPVLIPYGEYSKKLRIFANMKILSLILCSNGWILLFGFPNKNNKSNLLRKFAL